MRLSSWLPGLLATVTLMTPWTEVKAAPACKRGDDFIRDTSNCSRFYRCVHSIPFLMNCPDGTFFSESQRSCVRPSSDLVAACSPLTPSTPPVFSADDLDFGKVSSSGVDSIASNKPSTEKGISFAHKDFGLPTEVRIYKQRTKALCGKAACKRYCPYGYVQDLDDCNTCTCMTPTFSEDDNNNRCTLPVTNPSARRTQPCQNLLYNDCTFGYRINANGCLTCECASARETAGQKDVNEEQDDAVPFGVGTEEGGIVLDPNSNNDGNNKGGIISVPGPKLPDLHPQKECRNLPGNETRVAHPKLCHRFYECNRAGQGDLRLRKGLTAFERECAYPLQFDSQKRRCRYFTKVSCGSREQEPDFCNYADSMCAGGNCRPCVSLHPSCRGLANGNHAWPGREGSGFYVECEAGRTVREALCGRDQAGELMAFDAQMTTCRPKNDGIVARCQWLQNQVKTPQEEIAFLEMGGLLSHPDCHRYYNCSAGGSHVSTCPYPQQWDAGARRCDDFQKVSCGSRADRKTPCEYKECADADWGSCEDREDGHNVFRTREGTASYVTCLAERTVATHTCGVDSDGLYMHFSPVSRTCVSVHRSHGDGFVGSFK